MEWGLQGARLAPWGFFFQPNQLHVLCVVVPHAFSYRALGGLPELQVGDSSGSWLVS